MTLKRINIDIPETEDWLKPPMMRAKSAVRKEVYQSQAVKKRLSRAFGNKAARRNQLVARLKRKRGYKAPVRGGTGKQARTKRRIFTKHVDHDQDTHGNWADNMVGRVSTRDLEEIAVWPVDEGSFTELKDDIDENGILSPVEIGWHNGTESPEIDDGHHRLAAAKALGMRDLPVKIAPNMDLERRDNVRRWLNDVDLDRDIWIEEEDAIAKHLPGKHDQKTHGNWADGKGQDFGDAVRPLRESSVGSR